MSRIHRERETIYVIVRLDPEMSEPEHGVIVKEAVWEEATAAAEAERLNALNGSKGCRYVYQATRLFPPGSSAGGTARTGSDADASRPAV